MSRSFKTSHLLIGAALFLLLTCSAPLAPSSVGRIRIGAAPADKRTPAAPGTGATAVLGPAATSPAPVQGAARPIAIAPTAAPTSSPTSDELAISIDRYMADLTAGGWFSGAILVARDGNVILAKGYGPADDARGIANAASTRFRLASLTKQFTAAATLMLQSQGKLTLSDPICGYLEDCPDAWKPITIRHLLNHTSGLVDYTDFLEYEETESQPATPLQLVARFRDQPLAFTPGDYYDYCNSGYVLLGLIIERASGMSYPDFLRRAIFEPLDMQNTGYDTSESFNPAEAFPYRSAGVKASFLNTTTLFAAGGLYSTVEDMYRWDQALAGEQLLPRALLDEMFTPGNGSYGYGWKIERPADQLRLSHAGNMTGVSNFIARYPDQRLTVIVLSNMESANSIGISDYIASLVLGG